MLPKTTKYYMQVVNPDTKVERVRIHGQNILQVLHYMRRLGLHGVVVKADSRWANYSTYYTLGSDCRVYKRNKYTNGISIQTE